MTPLENLKKARERLAVRANWRQGDFLGADGSRCALGHLNAAAGTYDREAHGFLIAACKPLGHCIPIGVNDVPPPDEAYPLVLRMYDIAIALAGEAEAGSNLEPAPVTRSSRRSGHRMTSTPAEVRE